MEPVAYLQERIYIRWRLYDVNFYPKPITYVYGDNRKGS